LTFIFRIIYLFRIYLLNVMIMTKKINDDEELDTLAKDPFDDDDDR
jgi:hypothetical protein